MKIKEIKEEKDFVKIVSEDYEEPIFYLIKDFLEKKKDVDFVGVSREHYLKDETEIYIKFKGVKSPKTLLKKYLKELEKEVQKFKLK